MQSPALRSPVGQQTWEEWLGGTVLRSFHDPHPCAVFLIQELRSEPAEDVIHHRLGDRDLFIVGEAGGLEAHMTEFVDQRFERHAILQSQGRQRRERVHQT